MAATDADSLVTCGHELPLGSLIEIRMIALAVFVSFYIHEMVIDTTVLSRNSHSSYLITTSPVIIVCIVVN